MVHEKMLKKVVEIDHCYCIHVLIMHAYRTVPNQTLNFLFRYSSCFHFMSTVFLLYKTVFDHHSHGVLSWTAPSPSTFRIRLAYCHYRTLHVPPRHLILKIDRRYIWQFFFLYIFAHWMKTLQLLLLKT